MRLHHSSNIAASDVCDCAGWAALDIDAACSVARCWAAAWRATVEKCAVPGLIGTYPAASCEYIT